MKTEQTVFNVVWLDDEIDSLYDKDTKLELRDAGIKIIENGAHDIYEFKDQMERFYNKIDAVITDANINLHDSEDFQGLKKIALLVEQYNQKRIIPFFIYTGRDSSMKRHVDELLLEKFEGRQFQKKKSGDFACLINAIKETVCRINSNEFRLHNLYAKELKKASAVDEQNGKDLWEAILYGYDKKELNIKDCFNLLRGIIERILNDCRKVGVIPNNMRLSGMGDFLYNGGGQYRLKENIAPKPIARSLQYFLDITQDASHSSGDLNLKVKEYVEDSQSLNLYRTVLHIAMEVCSWYYDYKEKCTETNERKWEYKKTYLHQGIVTQQKNKENWDVLVCGIYQLDSNGSYSEGDIVGIKDEGFDNKHPFTYNNENGNQILVNKFINPNSVDILKRR